MGMVFAVSIVSLMSKEVETSFTSVAMRVMSSCVSAMYNFWEATATDSPCTEDSRAEDPRASKLVILKASSSLMLEMLSRTAAESLCGNRAAGREEAESALAHKIAIVLFCPSMRDDMEQIVAWFCSTKLCSQQHREHAAGGHSDDRGPKACEDSRATSCSTACSKSRAGSRSKTRAGARGHTTTGASGTRTKGSNSGSDCGGKSRHFSSKSNSRSASRTSSDKSHHFRDGGKTWLYSNSGSDVVNFRCLWLQYRWFSEMKASVIASPTRGRAATAKSAPERLWRPDARSSSRVARRPRVTPLTLSATQSGART
mmetsp:Transcript_89328/g.241360  ORF Transcript_89328/g.241360 Transcript_89328/m.241360 type:complete len:314 (-) Transcript_89328:153-1094(-)